MFVLLFCMVCIIYGSKFLKYFLFRLLISFVSVCAVTSRIFGIGFIRVFLSSGTSMGMYGVMFFGLVMRVFMFLVILVVFFFIFVFCLCKL